jgi:hypothetical protein
VSDSLRQDGLERPSLGETLAQNARTDAKLHSELVAFVGDGRTGSLDAIARRRPRVIYVRCRITSASLSPLIQCKKPWIAANMRRDEELTQLLACSVCASCNCNFKNERKVRAQARIYCQSLNPRR